MACFSYLCSKSGESIPIESICPTNVIAYYPDGSVVTGIYDGYGNIGGENYLGKIQGIAQDAQIRKARLEGGTTHYFQGDPKSPLFEYRLNVVADVLAQDTPIQHRSTLLIGEMAGLSLESLFKRHEPSIMRLLKVDFAKQLTRIVKAKYADTNDTFQTIKPSEECPYQGCFYDHDDQWEDAEFFAVENKILSSRQAKKIPTSEVSLSGKTPPSSGPSF
mgnify:CR=1 FL=1